MPRRTRRDAAVRDLLGEYDKHAPLYGAYASALKELIVQLLIANDVTFHSVTCRLKARASFERKLGKATGQYTSIGDVTDMCGVRIITYFEDTVDKIAALIEKEFEVDRVNSIDKRAMLDPDRFGYLSLHHIVALGPARSGLAEYRRYSGCKAEIQTRSILQHAWAEIEHDLGYKSNLAVPAEVRRRFARLAGLLELADKEFTGIREQLDEYQSAVPARIDERPEAVGIDKASLNAFVNTSTIIHELDAAIAGFGHAEIVAGNPDFVEDDPAALGALGIRTIDELDRHMRQHAPVIKEFAKLWLADDNHVGFFAGISLFYLWYVLIGRSGDHDSVVAALRAREIALEDESGDVAKLVSTTVSRALALAEEKPESRDH